jgi:outer membrane protein
VGITVHLQQNHTSMRCFLLITCCLFVWSDSLVAQTEIGSLEEAYALLSEQHTRLKSSRLQTEEWNRDLHISKSALLPSIKANAMTDYYLNLPVQLIPAEIFGGSPGTFQEVRFGQPWVMSTGLEFQWPLIHLERWKEQQRARLLAAQGPVREALEEEQLRMRVLQLYYTVLFWESYIPYAEDLKVQVDLLRQSADDKFGQQLISQFEMNRVEAFQQQISQQVTEAFAQREQAMLQLKESLQIDPNVVLSVSGTLEQPPVSVPQSTPLAQRPGLRLASLENERLQAGVEVREAALWPTLSLNSRYQYQWQTNELFNGGNYIGFDFGTVGLALQWNIYSGGQKLQQIEKTKIQARRGQVVYEETLYELQIRQAQWTASYQEARSVFDMNGRRYELTRQNLDLAFQRLDEGFSVIDEYFQIYQEYHSAAQSYFQNRLNLHLYHALLQL